MARSASASASASAPSPSNRYPFQLTNPPSLQVKPLLLLMSAPSHLTGDQPTLNRYFMELHNLKQRGEVDYTEDNQSVGPANARSWTCFITIVSLDPKFKQEAEKQTFWLSAEQKQAARDGAAKLVLLNIGYNGPVH